MPRSALPAWFNARFIWLPCWALSPRRRRRHSDLLRELVEALTDIRSIGFEYSDPPAIACFEYSIFSLICSADGPCRVLQLARGVPLIAGQRLLAELAELLLERAELGRHRALFLRELLDLALLGRAGLIEARDLRGDLLLLLL